MLRSFIESERDALIGAARLGCVVLSLLILGIIVKTYCVVRIDRHLFFAISALGWIVVPNDLNSSSPLRVHSYYDESGILKQLQNGIGVIVWNRLKKRVRGHRAPWTMGTWIGKISTNHMDILVSMDTYMFICFLFQTIFLFTHTKSY